MKERKLYPYKNRETGEIIMAREGKLATERTDYQEFKVFENDKILTVYEPVIIPAGQRMKYCKIFQINDHGGFLPSTYFKKKYQKQYKN